ncbi:3'-5' exonuclease [Colletotrichum scovillei]|uniref:3'-5' exonuclease n=1 Tax=Colletotrichum scovillei TaxID=1209932 RepID=A0A9P7R119_9PEZI|nr:3'-5' exonuclease [Colletotrichum scovillei]KAF4773343.1 3'-5' exonuclease [Colletotrichum scovillei]KAG7046640.1 3'-5' exonuclease [Colletotrichum scovillei]KAG7056521.1 3'-5' exonuclease [Colletotrichum scovillei]KAG7066409.1 3'-5' exonuclease [Colletotrichum scovillei]
MVASTTNEIKPVGSSLGSASSSDSNSLTPLAYDLVNTPKGISTLIDYVSGLPNDTVPLHYVDLEGDNLSRHGIISILQLYVAPKQHTYLLDIHALGDKAFLTPGERSGKTIKGFLEDPNTKKVFFDVRNDSDALFHHFRINLDGIQDLQLMEFASRHNKAGFLSGLSKCIERNAPMTPEEIFAWRAVKVLGHNLFNPQSGGSYAVFNQRPLSTDILRYCIQDVQYLPRLWAVYDQRLGKDWKHAVEKETKNRILQSHASDYNGQGRHMTEPPADWVVRKPEIAANIHTEPTTITRYT